MTTFLKRLIPTFVMVLLSVAPGTLKAGQTFLQTLQGQRGVIVSATAVSPKDGSLYVAGYYTSDFGTTGPQFGPISVTNPGKPIQTSFLAKMGRDGAWRWAVTMADWNMTNSVKIQSISATRDNVYVCGETWKGVWVSKPFRGVAGEVAQIKTGQRFDESDAKVPFAVKLNADGDADWAAVASNVEAGNHATAYDLAVDQSGNVYVCGAFFSAIIADPPAIGVGQGLNFGKQHAFRPRDPSGSGTQASGTDWSGVTTDGFVAKLNSSGTWQWVATAGGLEDGYGNSGLTGISVDTVGNVYVVGSMQNGAANVNGMAFHRGMTAAKWNVNNIGGAIYGFSLSVPNSTHSAWVGKIGGFGDKEGIWLAQASVGADTRGNGIAVANGTVYVAARSSVGSSPQKNLKLARFSADLATLQGTANIGRTASEEIIGFGNGLTTDADGNIYITGLFGYPQTDFYTGENATLAPTFSAYSALGDNTFVAKADKDLNWKWVRTANDPTPTLALPSIAVDSGAGRVYLAQPFLNGSLTIGSADNIVSSTASPDFWVTGLTALVTDTGEFQTQLGFEMISQFGGAKVDPPVGQSILFEGAEVRASVPPILYEDAAGAPIAATDEIGIRDRAVVRHICTGYEVLGTAQAGDTATFGFTITEDTRLRFNWRTEYALEVKNDLAGSLGGLTSTAAGNPDPVVQKHWIPEGEFSTAFIDGKVVSVNPNEFGTRYRSTGYELSGKGAPLPVLDKVLNLDGASQFVELGAIPAVSFTNGITLETWVRIDRFNAWPGILELGNTGGDTIYLAAVNNSRNLEMRIYQGASSTASAHVVTAGEPLLQGQWMHIAATLDANGNVTLYLNGNSIATRAVGPDKTPLAVVRSQNTLGTGKKSQLAPLQGRLGETRIWNVARTTEEIRSGMLRGLVGNEPGLVGYWKLASTKDVAVVEDLGPNKINGTIKSGSAANIVPSSIASIFQPWPSLQERQQIPQFVMNGPIAIRYAWTRENSVRVSASPSSLENVTRTVSDTQAYNGSGEFWFPTGTRVKVLTPLKPLLPAGYQLNSRDGHFIGGLGNVSQATGFGLVEPTDANLRYVEIPALNQGSALTWNYAQRVYQGSIVSVGSAIDVTRNAANAVAGTWASDLIPPAEAIDLTKPPTGTTILSNAPPGSTTQDMWIWDDVDKKLYPLRPGAVRLEWARQGGGDPVLTELKFAFPTDPYFNHIANTPPVPLDEEKTDSIALVGMKYSERSTALVSDAEEFSVDDHQFTTPFWSVLVFSQTTDGTAATADVSRERVYVRTVRTKRYSDGLLTRDATIGTAIQSSAQSTFVPHNGYVYFEQARYNPDVYDRKTRIGPIIPVNAFPTAKPEEKLVVVWYEQKDNLNWPAKAFQYNPVWPQDGKRIVIASRLGSEGVSTANVAQQVFAPSRYTDVKIYNQPDRTKPGYNPNEEHAVIAPSLINVTEATPAAFAFRNDLNNNTPSAAYTSDPYVLVQYFDKSVTNFGMAAFQVQVAEPNIPVFRTSYDTSKTGSLNINLGAEGRIEFNFTSGPFSQTGFRPGEIVEVDSKDNLQGFTGGRFAISVVADGPPAKFVLVPLTGGAAASATAITPGENPNVIVSRAFPYVFEYSMKAGQPVLAPYPLQLVIGLSTCPETRGENLDPAQLVYWEDNKKQPWAVSGSDLPTSGLRAQFYYPLPPDFWHPTAVPGACISFVSNSAPVWVTNRVTWPSSVPVLKAGETLTFSGGEINRDDANRPGVPGVIGWAAGKIVYDDANASMDASKTVTSYIGRLASPLLSIEVPLASAKVPAELQPASGNTIVNGTLWSFKNLDASLQPRIRYDQASQKLSVRGFIDGKTLGDSDLLSSPATISILQPNILTENDRAALLKLVGTASADWTAAVSNLVQLSRDPKKATAGGYGVGLEPVPGLNNQARPAVQFGPGLALLPNQGLLDATLNLKDGYLTLAENDDPSLGAAPVSLHIVRVRKSPLFRGAIKTINPPNPFDEKLTLRHSGDFGGNASDLDFEWYYRPDDGKTVAPPEPPTLGSWLLFADPNGKQGRGMQEISIGGAGPITLTDNRFFVRWKHKSTSTWSQWAGAANSRPPVAGELPENTYIPQLAEGWVKRVIGAINPFDARITDFRNNNTPATYASMVQQAGSPYRGPVALNAAKDVVENIGLIELYTTVLRRARELSIDLSPSVSTPAVNNTILLAASRIADLQLLLGNEAYTDAQDPTIGFGSASVEYGSLAPTVFAFQNQMASLLEEELALLRGRAEEGAYPAYNRLLWNFTRAEGEAAYALSYNISDANKDGFINEADARLLYPQGHGDAWGHYLSALRTYYDLLRHDGFNWQPRSESLQIEGVVVSVDYLDERKFAQAAAAKAKAGAEVVNLTYRNRYVEDPDGQWQGYQDTDANRAWGVSDWARRAGVGAYFDWVTANAILPSGVTNKTGIERVDRSTVKDLDQIAAQAVEIRKQLDGANTGLNPAGLATDIVPFDIDPIGFDSSTGVRSMHFDQVYDRANKALKNALDVFDNANQLNNMIRQVAATTEQFTKDAAAQDLDFRNRLIEVFGTPYEGTIGPGKAYPAGYSGPDIYLFMYADVTGIQNVPAPSTNFTAYFGQIDGGFIKQVGTNQSADTITKAWSSYFPGDAPNLEDNVNTDFSTKQLQLNMPITASGYSFQAPADWGIRKAPGEIQQVLSELVQAEADLQLALHDYDGLIGDLGDMVLMIQAQSGVQAETIRLQEKGRDRTIGLNVGILAAHGISAASTIAADTADKLTDNVADSLPKVVGLASDVFSTVRGLVKTGGTVSAGAARSTAMVSDLSAEFLEGTKEVAQIQQDIAIEKLDFKYAMQEQLKEFEGLLGDEAAKRIEVFRRQEVLRQISERYRALLESGQRLLEERALHNKQSAGATQQNRYQDFTFRVARNDALSKYRSAFDLAARYVYMAAKAYDYETNLDPNDPASARPILTQIIRARTLGAMVDGEPRLGSGGLADSLATLKVNFDVLRSQMGLNNPQGESGQFSLRNELFRMKGTNSAAWRQELEKYRVADLWQVAEYRRYCRPFAPQSAGAQPALVIPFGSQIISGKNFFGWPLGPGDSAYDPTQFATKVHSVGVWFDDYAGDGLATTPRVYLVPAGLDIMYVPGSRDFATREWNVVDQRIPIPIPVTAASLRDPTWIPVLDSLNGTISEIRRYSSFRAYHNAGFTADQMSFDSRLVGRSVWNTRWMLIIPGATFLSDSTAGLDTFIYGLKSDTGPATDSRGVRRDGNGVSDIKISFQTYAISGN